MESGIAVGTVVDAGIDWLTVTVKPDYPDLVKLQAFCAMEMALKAQEGEIPQEVRAQGYICKSVPGLMWGAREDGYVLRASGEFAKYVAKELKAYNPAFKITRIDLQVTAKREKTDTRFVSRIRGLLQAQAIERNLKRIRRLGTVENSPGGDSISVGSRTSDSFVRVYDKTAEQRGQIESDLLRFEVEYKGKKAREAWRMFLKAEEGPWFAISVVGAHLLMLDIQEPWMENREFVKVEVKAEINDDERRLKWLASHVKSTVDRLKEAGKERQAREALGFTDVQIYVH